MTDKTRGISILKTYSFPSFYYCFAFKWEKILAIAFGFLYVINTSVFTYIFHRCWLCVFLTVLLLCYIPMFIFSQIVMQKLSAGAVSCLSFIPSWKKSLRTLLQHQSLSHVNPMAVATNWSLKCASTCTLTQVSTSYPAILYFRIFWFHVSLKVLKNTKLNSKALPLVLNALHRPVLHI